MSSEQQEPNFNQVEESNFEIANGDVLENIAIGSVLRGEPFSAEINGKEVALGYLDARLYNLNDVVFNDAKKDFQSNKSHTIPVYIKDENYSFHDSVRGFMLKIDPESLQGVVSEAHLFDAEGKIINDNVIKLDSKKEKAA